MKTRKQAERTTETKQLKGGMIWKKSDTLFARKCVQWEASSYGDAYNFTIFEMPAGGFRLIAHDHHPSTQFPQADVWMREYATIEADNH